MGKKASPALIGTFVLAAIALFVAGVIFFGSGRFLTEKIEHVMFFEGSVGGLSVGAPVQFRGVRIGTVTNIMISYSRARQEVRIPVIIEIDPGRFEIQKEPDDTKENEELSLLIEKGLRAQLKPLSLVTGQLAVELGFHPDNPEGHVDRYGDYPVIPTIPSDIEIFIQKVESLPIEEIATNLSDAAAGINRLVTGPEIYETLDAFNRTLAAYTRLADRLEGELPRLAGDISETAKGATGLLAHIDGKVEPVAGAIADAAGEAGKLARDAQGLVREIDSGIKPILVRFNEAAGKAGAVLDRAEDTLAMLEKQLDEDSPLLYELSQTFKELSAASRSIRIMADYIERHPEALLKGKGGFKGLQELRR